ncbi:phosphatidylcholine/phosphatidylserine synthase [Halosegnis rubeus]|jgi:CDP-diacylglycerol--serine O-phosphatidyltransferase|uniref:Phosphatidylcholine/phosphatidylserine synthase n=1 Tax=Halosegnis rubeus TaxID=2212850 RepID=A0A5N5UKD9_9EURY|nr:protein sorting system archaetidylserine synthase [Halosegnis rubeus]KAB7514831.1 phosphatidylcholine/phosphatidylserine synthase [Halosegnis rubeus]KAB7519283.1 phosphatidylcholine/phosphatidylserine synthase [Halosegnis rubeus]
MKPRFVGRVSAADIVTVTNAAIGFVAAAVATVEPTLAARLILLGAIADGLDGVVARRYGSSDAGAFLDALADVSTFVVAPAVLVFSLAGVESGFGLTVATATTLTAGGLFVAAGVLRLGMYAAYDEDDTTTEGVQTTLAATLLAALQVAGVTATGSVIYGVAGPALAVGAAVVLAVAMLAPITYPDLLAGDALILGAVQACTVLFPSALRRAFPIALLICALAYVTLSPRFYWRE